MRVKTMMLALCMAVIAVSAHAQNVNVTGTLILADDNAGPSDASLGKLPGKLKTIFGAKRFTRIGGGKAAVAPGKPTTMNLGGGYSAGITIQGDSVSLKLSSGKKSVSGGGKLVKGGPPVLIGGMKHGAGKVIFALTR